MSPPRRDPEDQALVDRRDALLEQSEEEMARGRAAAALLENPLLNAALDTIERTWEQAWRNTPPVDTEKREQCYRILYALTEFRSELRTVLETGKLAEQTADTIQRERSVGGREPYTD